MFWKRLATLLIVFLPLIYCTSHTKFEPDYSSTTVAKNITPTLFASPTDNGSSSPTNTPVNLIRLDEEVRQRLIYGENCKQPCFLDITVNTKVEDAIKYVERFGFAVKVTKANGQDVYFSPIRGDTFPDITLIFTGKNGFVQTLNAGIEVQGLEQKQWQSYSPTSILKKYGIPDHVEFLLMSNVEAQKDPGYIMTLYYDNIGLVVGYIYGLFQNTTITQACPIVDQFESIDVWLGDVLDYQQSRGVPLDKATTLTISQFYNLLLKGSDDVCIDLDINAFPK